MNSLCQLTLASQRLHSLAQDVHSPLEVQRGIGGVGQAVPRMVLVFKSSINYSIVSVPGPSTANPVDMIDRTA